MLKHMNQFGKVSVICASMIMLGACQPKSDAENKTNNETAAQAKQTESWYIESKNIELKPRQKQVCDEAGCTEYSFQTVETNHPWINTYFKNRIEKADPIPFQSATKNSETKTVDPLKLSQSQTVVRYLSQHQNIASFEYLSYVYPAGAAHGMYHKEYVHFDLKTKKRIALQDLIVKGQNKKLLETLYSANSMWLTDHNIEQDKLELSDNFYYGVDGIVFVYPLYELASYAEGMSELTLPYVSVNGLIQSEYLPNLPKLTAE